MDLSPFVAPVANSRTIRDCIGSRPICKLWASVR